MYPNLHLTAGHFIAFCGTSPLLRQCHLCLLILNGSVVVVPGGKGIRPHCGACWLPPGLPGVGAPRVGLGWSAWTPTLQGGLFWGEGVPLRECSIDQEPRPPPRDTLVAKGGSCAVCRPPSCSGTWCLCRSERHRPRAGGGSDWPGRGPCERGREAFLA